MANINKLEMGRTLATDPRISTTSTFCPTSARHADRLIDVVVLPTPPFWLAIAIILPTLRLFFYTVLVMFHVKHDISVSCKSMLNIDLIIISRFALRA